MAAVSQINAWPPPTYSAGKIIHDPIWGTCDFEPWEVSILDLGVLQRLRGLRQTGFAYLTYPTAEHSRFQHTLGVMEASSKIFQSILKRAQNGGVSPRGRQLSNKILTGDTKRWTMLLRLAALVHDTGHSVFSHSSERIFGLVPPLPELIAELTSPSSKPPGAAEVIVYLMVSSSEWQRTIEKLWPARCEQAPPTPSEWEQIGKWVMGQEDDPEIRFLADIISGPLDADKLDYVFRDGYAAGIPVGYDLERLIATVCVDPQTNSRTRQPWWRLTLPVQGINALEQLIMGRLVLNSYLYHHQKCRAAETAFERCLAREYLAHQTILGRDNVWDLFSLQDADAYGYSRDRSNPASDEIFRLYGRQLRVRSVEFRRSDIASESFKLPIGYLKLLDLRSIKSWDDYRHLLSIEDEIATAAGLNAGDVILDVPKDPGYADLENLLLPDRHADSAETPMKLLNYDKWIDAYKHHRAFVRVFAPRDAAQSDKLWGAASQTVSGVFGFEIPDSCRFSRRTA